jgi:hypothetical protein
MGRIATTTAGASVTPAGLFQLGHRKAHRPDWPQGHIAMAVLDPLGLPWTTTVVAGQTADAPLSLPAMAKVRQTAQRTGLPSVGDGTRAALGTRAEIVARQDDSLCPLSAKQRPAAARASHGTCASRTPTGRAMRRTIRWQSVVPTPVHTMDRIRRKRDRPGESHAWWGVRWLLPRARRSPCDHASPVP